MINSGILNEDLHYRAVLNAVTQSLISESKSPLDGVFQLSNKDDHKGLIWVGSIEKCDECHCKYPMCWIIFDGKRFLCFACHYPDHRAEEELRNKYDKLCE